MRSSVREVDQSLMEPVKECRRNDYLLSSKKIGSGAFSKVYLGYATHEKLLQNYKLASDLRSKGHAMVAVKIISIAEAPPEYSRKFLPREIYSLNVTYKHMNVIQLYESFQTESRAYLVLELASRGDLLEYINVMSDRRQSCGLEEGEARRLFRQIVSAVAHCHSHGIVHRDLKCENILLDEQGFVKLTDFGFASQCTPRHSLLKTFCGSAAYTAPEILMRKKYNGEQADLWSLGVILYAMVTGKLPFKERQPCKMLRMIKRGLTFRCAVSQECQELIQCLLQWKPSARLDLQQVASHCWMLPTSSVSFQKALNTIGNQFDLCKGQEKELKRGKNKVLDTAGSQKEGMPKIMESAPLLPPPPQTKIIHPSHTSASMDAMHTKVQMSKKSDYPPNRSGASTRCRLYLPSPCQLEDSHSRSAPWLQTFFQYQSSPIPWLKPFHNLPNFRKPDSPYSSNSYPASKLKGEKVRVDNCSLIEHIIPLFTSSMTPKPHAQHLIH
ncbi:testis-specific serine/threonine-protein kinase 5-like isoform X1 [Rhinatrema bivittatum]|uniref:testis-specific serine/threonine-protein kinase 5-like isoform X1 n=1 Tax=Rhinatrema bivittatum TaxID=194408 RepID=UPI0011272D0A|nr:testis-specific serine/threonine-protein kinase 5-like isoform X1 [Rhinatrema bivittatum]